MSDHHGTKLERALAAATSRKVVDDEDIELALGWLQGRVSMTQVNAALHPGKASNNTLSRLATILREAYRKERLRIS